MGKVSFSSTFSLVIMVHCSRLITRTETQGWHESPHLFVLLVVLQSHAFTAIILQVVACSDLEENNNFHLSIQSIQHLLNSIDTQITHSSNVFVLLWEWQYLWTSSNNLRL